jgi:tetratricopeptide (TPR) repeat protein
MRGDLAGGRRQLRRSLASHPVASVAHVRRRYSVLVRLLIAVGDVGAAREVAARFERDHATEQGQWDERARHSMSGDIALAERRYDDAIAEYRAADAAAGPCGVCFLPFAAHAYDLSGRGDSALALFTRYVDTPDPFRAADFWDAADLTDGEWLPRAYIRLGQLWEERGNNVMAVRYYDRFVHLWKDADPEVQPQVDAVRNRLAALR